MLRAATVFLFACASSALCQGDLIQRNPGETLDALAQRVIPQDHELKHPPVEVQFGPPGKHIVILHAPKDETNFSGIILVAQQQGLKKYEIPGPHEIPGQFEFEIQAVLAENADRDPARELIVLYAYHRNGSTSDDGTACLVYHWDGKTFQVLKSASAKLVGAKTAAQIRARLRTGAKPLTSKPDSRGITK